MKKTTKTLGVRLPEPVAEVVKMKAKSSHKTVSKYIADKLTTMEISKSSIEVSVNNTPKKLQMVLAGSAGFLTGLATWKILEWGLHKQFPDLTDKQIKTICWTAAIAVGLLSVYGVSTLTKPKKS
jgi:hypothetical protein